jgi:hypothetical protein
LALFAQAIVCEHGWVAGSQALSDFFAAGYTAQNALEVVLGVTMKTLSNYANHLTEPALDGAFKHEAWELPGQSAAACCSR